MLVDDIKYRIEIVALTNQKRGYLVEIKERYCKERHFAVGPNMSLGLLIAKLQRELEQSDDSSANRSKAT